MSRKIYYTGDDWDIFATLKRNGLVEDVSTATDISAAIVSSDDANAKLLIDAPTQNSGAAGADWANGIVVVEIPRANTAITTYGKVYLELQITKDGKKKTWGTRSPINVRKGLIS